MDNFMYGVGIALLIALWVNVGMSQCQRANKLAEYQRHYCDRHKDRDTYGKCMAKTFGDKEVKALLEGK